MKYESKNIEFGQRLKHLRKQKGLDQMEAAVKIGIGYRSLQNHEGGRWPNKNNLQKYLDFYKCNKTWLLTGQGEPYPEEEKGDVAPSAVSEQQATYNDQPAELMVLAGKAMKILQSDTAYRAVLTHNINAFHHALQTEEQIQEQADKIKALEKKCEDLIKRLEALERKPADARGDVMASAVGGD